MSTLRPNVLGAVYMVLASLGYVVNDAAIRRITEEGPDVYQALCLRSITLAVVFWAVGRLNDEPVRRRHFSGPVLHRTAAEVVSSALFFAAVIRLPFANVQSILQIVPFAVTLTAALFLGERVQARRYLAVAIGFLGVLVIVRPATDGFSVWSLIVIASALIQTGREFATKRVGADIPTSSIAVAAAVGLAAMTAVLAPPWTWQAYNGTAIAFFVLSTASLTAGYHFSIQTIRVGDLSVSAPFRYSAVIGAVVVGYLFFSEIPDRYTTIGAAVVIAGGLWSIRLEREGAGSEPTPRPATGL